MGWQFKIFGLDRDLVSSRIHGVATKFSDVFDDDLYYDTLALSLRDWSYYQCHARGTIPFILDL